MEEPFFENNRQIVKLKCKCGKEYKAHVRTVNRVKFAKSCRACSQITRRDNDGRVYNVGDILMNLEILELKNWNPIKYEVKCLKCGNIHIVSHGILNKKKNNKGLECCNNCFEIHMKSKKNFVMYTNNISLTYYNKIEKQAKLRGIEFKLTPEYLESIYTGYCYLSGLPIKIGSHSTTNGKMDLGNASLDRIDSTIGYINGNVAWTSKEINLIKHNLSVERFIKLCGIIHNFNNKDL